MCATPWIEFLLIDSDKKKIKQNLSDEIQYDNRNRYCNVLDDKCVRVDRFLFKITIHQLLVLFLGRTNQRTGRKLNVLHSIFNHHLFFMFFFFTSWGRKKITNIVVLVFDVICTWYSIYFWSSQQKLVHFLCNTTNKFLENHYVSICDETKDWTRTIPKLQAAG